MSFTYLAYGLRIRSDICLAGLAPGEFDKADLEVHTRNRENCLPPTVSERLIYASEGLPGSGEPSFFLHSLGEKFFRLHYTDGAVFILDREGTRLWGEWYEPSTLEDFTAYLVGPILGFVLRQRGVTCLHASSIVQNGKAIALVGYKGSGKSTIAAAFALRGCGVLCEDIAAIDSKDGLFFIHSGYPRICLWPDSVAALWGSPDALPRIAPNWEKRFRPLEGGTAFQAKPLPLAVIYVLSPRVAMPEAPRLERLTPLQGFMELVQNTYMNFLLTRENRATEFLFLSKLVDAVPVRRLTPHSDPARIQQLCDFILSDIENHARVRVDDSSAITFS